MRVSYLRTVATPISDVYAYIEDDPIKALAQAAYDGVQNRVLISFSALTQLRRVIGFTQMRFYCNKKNVKKVDVFTKENAEGHKVVDFFTNDDIGRPAACGSFETTELDDSAIGKNCDQWEYGTWGHLNDTGNTRLYGPVAYIGGKHHFIMGGYHRFECDDYVYESDFQTIGVWAIFVR